MLKMEDWMVLVKFLLLMTDHTKETFLTDRKNKIKIKI